MRELPGGTVTFLFSDIEGSTRLVRQLRDRWGDVLAGHRRILRTAFESVGGREVDTQGDAFFFVFSRARDAVAGAAEAQRSLATEEWPEGIDVRVRMGIHTGEPSVHEEGYLGLDVVKAARIGAAAHGGQVLVSQTTRALIAGDEPDGVGLLELGEHRLKDLEQREPLYQLVVAGLQTRFDKPRTAEEQPVTPFAQASAPELVAQAEAAVRELRTSIEQQVADELRAAGVPMELAPAIPPTLAPTLPPTLLSKPPAWALLFGAFFLILLAAVVVAVVYLIFG